jgi:AmmeMemoRadiSam system protein B
MRQQGGVLVASDEVQSFLANLDASYLLDSERYREAKEEIVTQFLSEKIRPCSLCGRSYPDEPSQLKQVLDDVLAKRKAPDHPEGKLKAIVAPHIDLSAGAEVYASAYGMLRHEAPARVLLLVIGHHMADDIFCLTEKDFSTPLGIVKNDRNSIGRLRQSDSNIIAENDFEHRSEHSLEFQVLFLQHLLGTDSFTILPILCGSLMANLPSYNRNCYLEKVGPFLKLLKQIILEAEKEILIVAGVDFSHIGLKFGHQRPAEYIASRAEAHDRNLLKALSKLDADLFWEESISVEDQYNVCGFSALACLLEILPLCKGELLDYQTWHEAATQSAVSFSAVAFTA